METDVLFDTRIPPAACITYLRLRALAWGRNETPPFSPTEFEALTGIGRSTLYGHLKLLRTCDDLRWRTLSDATMVVSFTAASTPVPEYAPQDCPVQKSGQSRNLDSSLLDQSDQLANQLKKKGQSINLDSSRNLDARNAIFEALADVSGRTPQDRDWSKLPNVVRGILNKATSQLVKVGATPQQVNDFWPWWKANDFRGKKNQRPDPWEVVKQWTVYLGALGATNDRPDPAATNNAVSSRVADIQRLARERRAGNAPVPVLQSTADASAAGAYVSEPEAADVALAQ